MNSSTGLDYQLGGFEGGRCWKSPQRVGAQSQKVLKFRILMTCRGPNFDHSGVKYDLLNNF